MSVRITEQLSGQNVLQVVRNAGLDTWEGRELETGLRSILLSVMQAFEYSSNCDLGPDMHKEVESKETGARKDSLSGAQGREKPGVYVFSVKELAERSWR